MLALHQFEGGLAKLALQRAQAMVQYTQLIVCTLTGYTSDVLTDSLLYAEHARAGSTSTAPVVPSVEDVRLAVQARAEGAQVPKEVRRSHDPEVSQSTSTNFVLNSFCYNSRQPSTLSLSLQFPKFTASDSLHPRSVSPHPISPSYLVRPALQHLPAQKGTSTRWQPSMQDSLRLAREQRQRRGVRESEVGCLVTMRTTRTQTWKRLKRASWGRTGHQAALVASSEEQKRTRSTTERRNVDRSSPPVSVDLPVPPLLASLSPGSGRRPDCLSACSMRNALASLERRRGHMPSLASIGLTLRSLILFLSPPLCCCQS